MIVSALVVTLSPDPDLRASALASLAADRRLTLGDAFGVRLPVVTETATTAQGAALCEALGEEPGVVRVDVVSIDFSPASS